MVRISPVGYFGHWIVVHGGGSDTLAGLGLEPVDGDASPGWRYWYGDGIPDDLASLVAEAAAAGDGAAIGAWVFDSDCGQVMAISDDLHAAVAIQRDRAADELGELEHDPESLAHWSTCAPVELSRDDIEAVANRSDLFAEGTVDELFDRLGLPAPYDPRGDDENPRRPTRASLGAEDFGGFVAPLGSTWDQTIVGRERVPWRELRYVPGLGDGVLGLWDRESPAAPVETFPVSRRGEARLFERIDELQLPLRLETMGATALVGFVEPLGLATEQHVAGRRIPASEARFICGRGVDFIGLWDRDHPEEPLERFKDDDEGWNAASRPCQSLLFQFETSAIETSGIRRYRAPGPRGIQEHEKPELDLSELSEDVRRFLEDAPPSYGMTGFAAYLILEEEADARVDASPGRFVVYAVGAESPHPWAGGEGLRLRARRDTIEEATKVVSESEHADGMWIDVPADVAPTLLETFRWAEDAAAPQRVLWYEQSETAAESLSIDGDRWYALAFQEKAVAGVVLVSVGGDGRSNAYLFLTGGPVKHLGALGDAEMLKHMLYDLSDPLELSQWLELPPIVPGDIPKLSVVLDRLADHIVEQMRSESG